MCSFLIYLYFFKEMSASFRKLFRFNCQIDNSDNCLSFIVISVTCINFRHARQQFKKVFYNFSSLGSHSLWMFATLVKGDTPFPEFSAIFQLDDIQTSHARSLVLFGLQPTWRLGRGIQSVVQFNSIQFNFIYIAP